METPIKERPEVDVQTAITKKVDDTRNELTTDLQLSENPNNVSFNFLGTNEVLQSMMNLNITVNKIPPADEEEILFDQNEKEDDLVSIEDKMDSE